jgi:hypothetical protein
LIDGAQRHGHVVLVLIHGQLRRYENDQRFFWRCQAIFHFIFVIQDFLVVDDIKIPVSYVMYGLNDWLYREQLLLELGNRPSNEADAHSSVIIISGLLLDYVVKFVQSTSVFIYLLDQTILLL